MKILVIEDEPAVAQTLQFLLTSYNYAVDIATDGEAGLEMTEVFDYDLIVLDIMLPRLDGISLCRQLRVRGFMNPILLLTGLGESRQKAIALDTGADDYIVKPFDTHELIARVQALLRRGSLSSQPILRWGQLAIDPSSCKVAYDDHLLSLTPKEYAILELFLRNPKKALSSKVILDQAWTSLECPTEDAVRVHIKDLRKKLATVGAPKDFIKSKHGIGYQLNPLYSFSLPPQKTEQLTAPDMAELKAVNEELRTTLEQLRAAQAQLQQQHQELTVAYQTIEQEREQLQTSRHELEQRLAQLTAELQHLHDYTPCGYHSLDAQGRIVEINETELTMLGYSREEVIGRKITDFYTPEGMKTFEENYPIFKQRGWVNDLEFTIIRKDGSLLPVSISATAIKDEAGNFLMSRSIVVDISDRKRREANLAFLTDISETCSRLSSAEEIIQNVGEKIGAYLQVVGCNFSEIDEVQDQVIYFGCWQAAGEPSLPSRICLSEQVSEEFYRRAKAGETIVSNNTQTNSVTDAEANASIGVLSFITVPFHKNGEWKYLFSIHDNEPRTWREDEIQLVQELANRLFPRLERARAEVALQESEERYRYLVEITPQLLWKADTQGYNTYISPQMAEYIGLSPEELLNLDWQTAIHPDDLDRINHHWMESVQTGIPYQAEYRLRRADGVYRWHLVRAISLQKGSEREWFGVSTDIGDSKETEAALEQQLLREKTLAVISQDIRSSLRLDEVLSRTVDRVRELLKCDRAIIFRFLPDWRGEVIVESVGPEWPAILSTIIFDPCFGDRYIEPYRQGRIATMTDIDNEDLEPCYVDLLKQFQVKANLVVPILQKENLWGLLIIHQCSAPRQWLRSDIDLLQQLATQVEIAIQQSELYEKTRQELAQRKRIQQQLQTIVDNSPTVIYLIDPQNRHLLVNRAYAEILCTTPENLLGKSIYEVWPANIAAAFDFNNQQVLETGQLLQTEEIAPLADGLHTYITVKFPLCDAGGRPYAICGISTDITERQKAEQKIREQAALIDIASDAIFVHDLENRIVFWNQGAERMYGWTVTEAVGKNVQELFNEETTTELRDGLKNVLVKGLWQTELTQTTKAGNQIIVASRWNLMRDSSGQPQSILVVNSDITERKQLERQFYHAQRLESLGTLASGIAHDLNNVLTPILAISQLLPRKFPDLDERTRQLLTTLESSARRGAEMVKPILAFARGNGGQHIPLQIAYLLSEVVQIAGRTFPKGIEISANLPEQELWLVFADPTQLHQVFMNLMVNARDAMPVGGCLTIEARNFLVDENYARLNLEAKVGPYVAVTVADTGTGFSPHLKEHIFEPFFTTKEVGKGTGLGLSTVLGIVKNHGGFIQVSSEIGKGSQFTVYLPAIRENAEISQVAAGAELLKGKGELILIVDDEPAVREITQSCLEEYNYTVILASDGIEALSIYAQYQDQINVILIDIMMPNLDGITAIRTFKKMNPDVKIIAMSGLSSQKETALAAGAGSFLPKPYTAQSLLMSLSEITSPKYGSISQNTELPP